MLIRSTAIWLLTLGALVSTAGRAVAQPAHSGVPYQSPQPTYEHGSAPYSNDNPKGHDVSPFKPVGFEPEFNWFAPSETSGYGKGPKPNVGYYFSYERVYWTMSKPESQLIGSETAPPPDGNSFISDIFGGFPATNSINTGLLTANGGWGNRWELGYMDVDDYGWFVSVLDHVSQSQYHRAEDVTMQFDDPASRLVGSVLVTINDVQFLLDIGKMVVQFDEALIQNITRLNGFELNRVYRARQLHSGAYFELLYGARWLQMQDMFLFIGNNVPPVDYVNPLFNSQWKTMTQNNMVGPEIGMRFFRQRGRWISSVEARFLAAANFQNVHQETILGDRISEVVEQFDETEGVAIPRSFLGLGTATHDFATTFSPVGELKVNFTWQATRSVGLKFGYTGMVIGNVSRASTRIDYSGVNLVSILNGNRNDLFFVNGINFGVEVNR